MPEMTVRGDKRLARDVLAEHRTGEMRILSEKGDLRVTWNARDADEVAAARSQFEELRNRGFMAYAVVPGEGGRGEQVREFDPNAQKLILAPPMAGGR
jgi:hypothetical protein